jgi:DNA-binding transcriptional regulator YbjK
MARVSSEQRRQDLVAAAVELILEGGPSAVTARKVAERAGAPLGIVHYTFRDMDELTHLANIEVLNRAFGALGHVRTDHGVREFVRDFSLAYLQLLQDRERELLAFFETLVSLIRPAKADDAYRYGEKYLLELLSEAAKHDTRPSKTSLPQLATLLIFTLDGLSLIHLTRRDHRKSAQDVEQLIAAIQHLV